MVEESHQQEASALGQELVEAEQESDALRLQTWRLAARQEALQLLGPLPHLPVFEDLHHRQAQDAPHHCAGVAARQREALDAPDTRKVWPAMVRGRRATGGPISVAWQCHCQPL